jgi:hypothetical protein
VGQTRASHWNLEAWIRNAEASLRHNGQGMPDTSNDKAQDSPNSETNAKKEPAGQVCAETGSGINPLILQGIIFS